MSDDEVIDAICDGWPDTPECWATYESRYEHVPVVLAVLRALPVDARMEAMGMEPIDGPSFGPARYVERGSDA